MVVLSAQFSDSILVKIVSKSVGDQSLKEYEFFSPTLFFPKLDSSRFVAVKKNREKNDFMTKFLV